MGASKYSYTMTQNHRLFVLFFNSHWPTDSHQWNVRKSPDRLSPVSSYISFFPKHSQHFWLKQVHLIVTFPEDFKDKRQQVNIFFSSLSLGYFFGRHLWKKNKKQTCACWYFVLQIYPKSEMTGIISIDAWVWICMDSMIFQYCDNRLPTNK